MWHCGKDTLIHCHPVWLISVVYEALDGILNGGVMGLVCKAVTLLSQPPGFHNTDTRLPLVLSVVQHAALRRLKRRNYTTKYDLILHDSTFHDITSGI